MYCPPAAIRTATATDVPALVESYAWLAQAPGRPPPYWDPGAAADRLERALRSPESTVLVACDGQKLVGFCTVYLEFESVRFGRRAWIEDLAVHPDRRSAGIGQRLLSRAKGWAREHGADRMGLESGEARVDAHRFYERERPAFRSRSFGWDLRRPADE